MRHLLTAFLLFCSLLSFAQEKLSFVKKLPVPHRAVNDFGRFLTSSERTTLDIEQKSYLKRTSNAIVIVTLDSLTDPKTKQEYSVEEAASLYFNTWGIGDSIKNNGVLLLASRKPRRVRIEVGKGLPALDDYFCQGVIDNNLVPAFKKEHFFTGFKEAITELENRLDNPPAPVLAPQSAAQSFTTIAPATSSSWFESTVKNFFQIVVFIFGIIVIVGIALFRARMGLPGGYYSRGGYRRHGYGYWSSNDDDRWNNNNSSSTDFFSGSSDSSFSSSSSSSSGSYSGGSSSGGGASGSW
jgi:uncharacterized protein